MRRIRHHAGGIADLLRLADEHGGALEYDLMTRAGATLDMVPAQISWTALRSFVTHLDQESAVYAELNPEGAAWARCAGVKTLLADLYDLIAAFRWEFCAANTPARKAKPQKPRPYQRPGAKDDRVRVGSDPIPISEFDDWWEGGA